MMMMKTIGDTQMFRVASNIVATNVVRREGTADPKRQTTPTWSQMVTQTSVTIDAMTDAITVGTIKNTTIAADPEAAMAIGSHVHASTRSATCGAAE
jgi:hypothetical protein